MLFQVKTVYGGVSWSDRAVWPTRRCYPATTPKKKKKNEKRLRGVGVVAMLRTLDASAVQILRTPLLEERPARNGKPVELISIVSARIMRHGTILK